MLFRSAPQGSAEQLAGATLLRHPSAGSLYPVSYTHLDVYKRQVVDHAKMYKDTDELLKKLKLDLSLIHIWTPHRLKCGHA